MTIVKLLRELKKTSKIRKRFIPVIRVKIEQDSSYYDVYCEVHNIPESVTVDDSNKIILRLARV